MELKIREMGASRHVFDEVAADIRILLPSSQYHYESNIKSHADVSSQWTQSSSFRI
jgi:hypothetical protein